MYNAPAKGIRTDFAVNDIFKPANGNAIAQSIPYDYIITDEMIAAYIASRGLTPPFPIDVGLLLKWNTDTGAKDTTGIAPKSKISVMIAAHTDYAYAFAFNGDFNLDLWDTSVSADLRELHIYSRTSWTLYGAIDCATSFIHTSGEANCVSFNPGNNALSSGRAMYVGAFRSDSASIFIWNTVAPFTYERCIAGGLPSDGGNPDAMIQKRSWMSNPDLSVAGNSRVMLLDATGPATTMAPKGDQSIFLSKGDALEDIGIMPTGAAPLSMDAAVSLDWYTWDAAKTSTGFIENPNRTLYIDATTLSENVVYEANFHLLDYDGDRVVTVDTSTNPASIVPPSTITVGGVTKGPWQFKLAFYDNGAPVQVHGWYLAGTSGTPASDLMVMLNWNIAPKMPNDSGTHPLYGKTAREIAWGRALFAKVNGNIITLRY